MITPFDERRNLAVFDHAGLALSFAAKHIVKTAAEAIKERGLFTIALSGGSTPKAIFQLLASPEFCSLIDWGKVKVFWSDERAVPSTDKESNYHMAMEAGLSTLPIPKDHLFRMPADRLDLKKAAKEYETIIKREVPDQIFDFIMLGMGEDGHTASLFPKTEALHAKGALVVANFIPEKNTWRMTLTFDCINKARIIAIYVIGASKKETFEKVFKSSYDPDQLPIQRIGTKNHKALWITDLPLC